MRSIVQVLSTAACLTAVFLSIACSSQRSSGHNSNQNTTVVYGQPGQTVKDLIDSLPPTGGTVILGNGVWLSAYASNDVITKDGVTIQGSGRPEFNSDFTAMVGGTIIRGSLLASTGANYLTVRDLGIDAGREYIDANNAGVPTDAFAIYNGGEVLGAPQVESPVIENVACLGYSTTAPFHCMLVENANHAWIHNVVTVMNQHGLVIKSTNSNVYGVFSRGHGIDSILVKSDDYAPATKDSLSNIAIQSLFTAGDTKGISVIGNLAPVSDVTISSATILSPLAWGINVRGILSNAGVSNLTLSDISIDYPGGSPEDQYCLRFANYVSNVQITGLNCYDMWQGIISYLPTPNTFDDFMVRHSSFENIATDAIATYGRWFVSDSKFQSVVGNGLVNPQGITAVHGNIFINIGGSDMLSTGGTFVADSQAP